MQNQSSSRTAPDLSHKKPPRRPGVLRKLIPIVMVALMLFLVLKDQFPVVNDTVMGFIAPRQQAAIEVCRDEALTRSPQPSFTRFVRQGKATATAEGFLVNRLRLGVPDAENGERLLEVTCHIGSEGQIVNFHMGDAPPQPVVDSTPPVRNK